MTIAELATQFQRSAKNGSNVERSSASATSSTKRGTSHWLRHGATSTTSTRPRHLRRRKIHHGCPCLEDRCMLLCCSSADTQHSTVCQQAGATISRHITCIMEVRLSHAFPSLLDCLQSILNAAARLIYRARKYDHVSPLTFCS